MSFHLLRSTMKYVYWIVGIFESFYDLTNHTWQNSYFLPFNLISSLSAKYTSKYRLPWKCHNSDSWFNCKWNFNFCLVFCQFRVLGRPFTKRFFDSLSRNFWEGFALDRRIICDCFRFGHPVGFLWVGCQHLQAFQPHQFYELHRHFNFIRSQRNQIGVRIGSTFDTLDLWPLSTDFSLPADRQLAKFLYRIISRHIWLDYLDFGDWNYAVLRIFDDLLGEFDCRSDSSLILEWLTLFLSLTTCEFVVLRGFLSSANLQLHVFWQRFWCDFYGPM